MQMGDPEPLRSVQVIHQLDSHVPTPLLSTTVASTLLNPGKLGPSTGSSSMCHRSRGLLLWSLLWQVWGVRVLVGGPIVNHGSNITKYSMASGNTLVSGSSGNVAFSRSITRYWWWGKKYTTNCDKVGRGECGCTR